MKNDVGRQNAWNQYKYLFFQILGILSFILIWQLVIEFGLVDAKYITKPLDVLKEFIHKFSDSTPDGSTLPTNIFVSFSEAIVGFTLAIAIGIPMGLCMGWYSLFNSFMKPLVELIRPIPPIAWIPLSILWLGIGYEAKIFIIFFAAFFPSVINSYTGVQLTKQVYKDFAKTCGASDWQIFRKIAIPSAMPMVFAGIKLSLGFAWATLVAAELLASTVGLGYMIMQGRQFGRTDIILVGMITIGLLGIIMSSVFDRIEKHVLRWRVTNEK